MLSSAQRFLSVVIADGKIDKLLQYGKFEHLFKGEELKLHTYFTKHVQTYGAMPDFDLIKNETGFDLAPQTQPAEFYLDKAKDNFVQQTLLALFDDIHTKYLKGGVNTPAQPSEGLRTMAEAVMKLATQQMGNKVVDYREAYDLIMSAYVAKATAGNNMGLMLGWPTLDKMTGGLSIGDLISFIGRPAMGKSWFMLYMALHAWSQGKVPMFVSMEMQPLIIQQRLLAIQAELPFSGLRDGALTTADYKKMKTLMLANKHGTTPFHVIDGNLTATVSDIYTLARQLKPDLVIIDGAYLLKHPTERDRFKRVAENADLIKQQICALAPTLCSWQFARPQKGNKSSKVKEAPTLDDIGYTDAIGQLSALVCGIMQPESAETTKQREVLILKGRNGEAGQFNVNWDFDFTTNFSEVTGELEASTKFADE